MSGLSVSCEPSAIGRPLDFCLQRLSMPLRSVSTLVCTALLLASIAQPVRADASAAVAAEPAHAPAAGVAREPVVAPTIVPPIAPTIAPTIVPPLAAGDDTQHLAAVAMAEAGQGKSQPAAPPHWLPGPSARLAEAAAQLQSAAHAQPQGKALSEVLGPAQERLRAAELLLRAGYPLFAEQPVANALGLSGVLKQRAAESLSRWADSSAALVSAAEALRAAPNAKAAQDQLRAQLAHLLPAPAAKAARVQAQLPVHRPGLAPAPLVQGNAIAPSYADPSDPLPRDEDLVPAGEAQFTPGVLRQAQSLGYRYTDLFDFVRSNVRTEWSAGSTQGPDRTLRRLAGNDVEQATLLIALLRASGAPARYVQGVVEVPVADLAQQMGVPPDQLGRALGAAGIAHRARASGGRVVAYQIRHIWVSARVPYGNYRGSVADTTEPTWIPLMPALKPAAFNAGAGVHSRLPFDVGAWLRTYLGSPQSALPWPELRQRWAVGLAALQPPVELASLQGQHEVDAAAIGLLPASTPYPVVEVHAEYGVLPDEERQWLRVRMSDPAQPQAAPLLDARVALSDLVSNRFVLGFLPATVEDQHMTNANGSLGAFPLNLIRLRPSLMSEGRAAMPGRGVVVGGTALELSIAFETPNGELGYRQSLSAGSIAGFAIDPHGSATPEAQSEQDVSAIPQGGLVLSRFAERYLVESARAEVESAALMGLRVIRPAPALALALPQVEPQGVAGLTERLDFKGVALDAALRPLEPIALHERAGLERDWLRLSALHGSALESQLFEELWGVPSVSADRLMQQAGADLIELAPGADLTVLAAHPEAVRQQVAHWLAQGAQVALPRAPQTVSAWTGSAWRVDIAETGESGYFLTPWPTRTPKRRTPIPQRWPSCSCCRAASSSTQKRARLLRIPSSPLRSTPTGVRWWGPPCCSPCCRATHSSMAIRAHIAPAPTATAGLRSPPPRPPGAPA